MIKQVIIIRKDLKMRRGKEIAQGAHASIAFIARGLESSKEITTIMRIWFYTGTTKVTLQVNSEAELQDIYENARMMGLEAHLITDAGKTEFDGIPTVTCLAIGPDIAEKIDVITGHLKLY